MSRRFQCKVWVRQALLAVGVGGLIGVVPQVLAAAAHGGDLFSKRCGNCHESSVLEQAGSAEWSDRLQRLAAADPVSAEGKALDKVVANHAERKSASLQREKRVFEKKCSLCHSLDRIWIKPLTDESRRHIVYRMRERAPDWITNQDMQLILDYLGKTGEQPAGARTPPQAAQDERAAVFRKRCSACHTLERVYLELDKQKAPDWMHIVTRMRTKAGDWIGEKESKEIIDYLKSQKPLPHGVGPQ